jgi:hypothetical protein
MAAPGTPDAMTSATAARKNDLHQIFLSMAWFLSIGRFMFDLPDSFNV